MKQLGVVEKAVDVLFHLHAAPGPVGVTAIGRELAMPKSSVHRLLVALARRGLVEHDARGQYRPGVALVALGLGVLEREPVVVAARPVLERSAQDLRETFFLVSARAGALVVLDKAEGTGFLRAAPRVGTTVPVHATAVGKLYLALAPDQLEKTPGRVREAFTPHTLVSDADLEIAAQAACRAGVASNLDEWIPGLSVLAAPVWLGTRLVASVAIAVPSLRLVELGYDVVAEGVRSAGEEISGRLGGPR